MSEWIKCSERLPEVGEYVLFWEKWSKVPCIGWLNSCGKWMASKEFVKCDGNAIVVSDIIQELITHWMPLPQPPEAE